MDLVCNLSQWAGCYQAIQNQAKTSKMMNPTGTGRSRHWPGNYSLVHSNLDGQNSVSKI